MLENATYAKDMKEGVVYSGGAVVGDFWKDSRPNHKGKVWWKSSYSGEITLVNPHPKSLFYETEQDVTQLQDLLQGH